SLFTLRRPAPSSTLFPYTTLFRSFTVFRGGSGSKSRRTSVLRELIEHMNSSPQVIYGLTVDGSRGPVHRVKPGCVAIARACRARSEEHTSELQSQANLVCRLLLEK